MANMDGPRPFTARESREQLSRWAERNPEAVRAVPPLSWTEQEGLLRQQAKRDKVWLRS